MYLILTFFLVGGYGTYTFSSATMPEPYANIEACNMAGAQAKRDYKGGAKLEWLCVSK